MFQRAARMRPNDSVRSLLDHRWMGMALLLFVVGVFAENPILLSMTGFMLIVTTFAWFWSRNALKSVKYSRHFQHKRAFVGETIELEISVENRKLLPLAWIQIEDQWAVDFGPVDETRLARIRADQTGVMLNGYTLRWHQRVRRHLTLEARARGIYEIGPARALSGDPFSLFERERNITPPERLIVYPEIKTLEELGLPVKDPLGDYRTPLRLFEDPNRIMGIRDYRPEDGLRHVHWKATARASELQTKVYEPTRSAQIVLCLNMATYEQHWHGVWPDMLEYLVTTAASLSYWGIEQRYAMGVIANGTVAHADQPCHVLPGQSRDQLMWILETLAGVTYFVTAEYGKFLLEESPRLPWGATLVLITPFVNDSIRATIIRLRDSGRQIVLIALGKDEPEPILGVVIHHLPIQAEEPDWEALAQEQDAEIEETPRQRFLREQAAQREQAKREQEL